MLILNIIFQLLLNIWTIDINDNPNSLLYLNKCRILKVHLVSSQGNQNDSGSKSETNC